MTHLSPLFLARPGAPGLLSSDIQAVSNCLFLSGEHLSFHKYRVNIGDIPFPLVTKATFFPISLGSELTLLVRSFSSKTFVLRVMSLLFVYLLGFVSMGTV